MCYISDGDGGVKWQYSRLIFMWKYHPDCQAGSYRPLTPVLACGSHSHACFTDLGSSIDPRRHDNPRDNAKANASHVMAQGAL